MAAPPPPPPPPRGFSLYENLHDPNDPSPSATISSSPVLYSSTTSTPTTKKPLDPALRFQPTRRPQPPKPKARSAGFPKPIPKPAGAAPPPPEASTAATEVNNTAAATAATKSTLADWAAAAEDDEWRYGTGEKRQRGGRKAKKKRQQQYEQAETDWDDVYDPSRPTHVEEYLRSDEKVDEVRAWKALLYRHRRSRAPASDEDMSSDEERPTMRPMSTCSLTKWFGI